MEIHKDLSRGNSECWRNARDLTVKTYRLVSNGSLNSEQELKRALIKTTVSIMSYLAIAQEQVVQGESLRYLGYALECVATFRTCLVIIRELGYIGEGQFLDFEDQSVHISALIHDWIKEGNRKGEIFKSTNPRF
jgi:four helix bundle protein